LLYSTSQWVVPLLYFLWPGEAVKCCSPGHRPATSTYTNKQNILYYYQSICIRYEGFSACFFLSAHLLQTLSPDEREADNSGMPSAHLFYTLSQTND
jgi:hypothetical protein